MTNLSFSQTDSILVHKSILQIIDSCTYITNSYDALVKVNNKRLEIIDKQKLMLTTLQEHIKADSLYINKLNMSLEQWIKLYEDEKRNSRKKSIALWSTVATIPLVAILMSLLTSLIK